MLRLVTFGLAILYTLLFVLWRGLLLSPLYDHFWQLRLSEVFAPWLYLPLFLLLLMALLTRQRWALLVLLIPLAGFGAEYGRQLLPNWQGLWYRHTGVPSVRVLTWNTHYTTDDTDDFFQTLTALQPDLVALQEVSYFLRGKLARELQARYPYQVVDALGNAESLAVLSRFPVLEQAFDSRMRGCRCQEVTIDFHGRPVRLINSHAPSPRISFNLYRRLPQIYRFDTEHQQNTAAALLTRTTAQETPLILAGDLNLMERQAAFRRLRPHLDDAFEAAGWGMGFTFPAGRRVQTFLIPPFVRIDHILYTAHWQALMAQVGPPLDSDHLYVVADLRLTR